MTCFTHKTLSMLSVIIAGGLLLAAQAHANEAESKGESLDGIYLMRPSFVVRNIEESLKFYRDILGYEVYSINGGEGMTPSFYTVYNIPNNGKGRFAALNSNRRMGEFALAEYADYQPVEDPTAPRSAVILVNANGHFEEIVAKAKAAGYRLLPEHWYSETGREQGIVDRDGHLVVLYENSLNTSKSKAD